MSTECVCALYLDDALAGGQWQPHQAGVIDGHNLVPNAEFSRAGCRATVEHAGQDDGGQDGAPTRLNDHHTEALPLLLLHIQLQREAQYSARAKGNPSAIVHCSPSAE